MTTPTSDLTEATVTGNGVFDELMKAAKAHLEQEYSNNRIKGKEYADVYLGSMIAVLDQAVKFMGIRQQDALIAAQIAKVNAERELVQAQIAKTNAEAALLPKQGQLIDAQIAKTNADRDLVVAQLGLIPDQKAKTQAETAILVQKKKTEEAQIKDTVDGANVTGVIGKQKDVYTEQAKGFKKKAEADIVKIMSDIWSVARTTDDVTPAPDQAVGDNGGRLNTNLIAALNNAKA